MKNKLFIFCVIIFCLPCLSVAEMSPQSSGVDKHVQVVTYDPNQVYLVHTTQGFTTAIELAPDEKIVAANIGDSSSWLINVQDNIVNLKPIVDNPDTNLNLITSRGTYQFFLTALPPKRDASGRLSREPNENTVFLLRFKYKTGLMKKDSGTLFPDQNSFSTSANTPVFNLRYTAQGNPAIAPVRVFDDGKFTYFDFDQRKDIPAIFTVDDQKRESLVNYHVQGRYVVVETIGKQFTLRNGSQVASIFNEDCR